MMTRTKNGDLYAVLELEHGASKAEIEVAYQNHLDRLGPGSLVLYAIDGGGDLDVEREKLDAAYRVLCDDAQRDAYDQELRQNFDEEDFEDSIADEEDRSEEDIADLVIEAMDTSCQQSSLDKTNPIKNDTSLQNEGLDPDALHGCVLADSSARKFSVVMALGVDQQSEYNGDLLRRLRESSGATLLDVAEITKIGRRYLKAIESNDFEALPAAVYIRGFVAEYAKVLGLDAKLVADSYMDFYRKYRGGGSACD